MLWSIISGSFSDVQAPGVKANVYCVWFQVVFWASNNPLWTLILQELSWALLRSCSILSPLQRKLKRGKRTCVSVYWSWVWEHGLVVFSHGKCGFIFKVRWITHPCWPRAAHCWLAVLFRKRRTESWEDMGSTNQVLCPWMVGWFVFVWF